MKISERCFEDFNRFVFTGSWFSPPHVLYTSESGPGQSHMAAAAGTAAFYSLSGTIVEVDGCE